MSKPLPPIQFLDLDTLRQVSGRPALLADHGLRSSESGPLQGPKPGENAEETLKAYRAWLNAQLKTGQRGSQAACYLDELVSERARLAESGKALTLGYVGADARPYAEVVAKCLDFLATKGWPQPAA